MSEQFMQPGDTVNVLESNLTHADPGDLLVNVGQPVVFGVSKTSGIARISAVANTDLIPVGISGVYRVSVTGKGDAGAGEVNEAVAFGDKLYYDPAVSVVNRDEINGSFFGIALGAVGSGLIAEIPVLLGGPQA